MHCLTENETQQVYRERFLFAVHFDQIQHSLPTLQSTLVCVSPSYHPSRTLHSQLMCVEASSTEHQSPAFFPYMRSTCQTAKNYHRTLCYFKHYVLQSLIIQICIAMFFSSGCSFQTPFTQSPLGLSPPQLPSLVTFPFQCVSASMLLSSERIITV